MESDEILRKLRALQQNQDPLAKATLRAIVILLDKKYVIDKHQCCEYVLRRRTTNNQDLSMAFVIMDIYLRLTSEKRTSRESLDLFFKQVMELYKNPDPFATAVLASIAAACGMDIGSSDYCDMWIVLLTLQMAHENRDDVARRMVIIDTMLNMFDE